MAQDIGLLLRGIGAAVTNQVPQFREQMAQESERKYIQGQREQQAQMQRAELTQARQQAMYKDAESALKLLAAGDLDGVVRLGQERIELLKNFPGADPSDTVRITQLAQLSRAGDRGAYQALQRELLGAVQTGMAAGYIVPPQQEEYTLKPGESRFRGGEIIASIPGEAQAQYRILTNREIEERGLEPGSYQVNERTGQTFRIGTPSTVVNVGQATESERTAGILANRLDFAQGQIKDILLATPGAKKPAAGATALNALGLGYLARVANPQERQIIEAAQTDMLDAALTLGTGAAYTKEQLEGYRTSYFPQLGDDEQTIKAKAQRLNNLVEAAYSKAGRAAPAQRLGAQSQAPQDWISSGLTQADWDLLSESEQKEYREAQ